MSVEIVVVEVVSRTVCFNDEFKSKKLSRGDEFHDRVKSE